VPFKLLNFQGMRIAPGVWPFASALALALLVLGIVVGLRWMADRKLGPDERVVYKNGPGHRLELHVFHPASTSSRSPQATPALLFFHGGGWQGGDARQFYPQCRHFSQRGLTCISVSYRTASAHGSSPFDAVQDARDAMRYVRRHASELGVLRHRIAAGGGSAGGHLAAALGVALPLPDPGFDPTVSTRPDALLLYNPMLDLAPGMPDHHAVAENWRAVSPRHHIDPEVPPTLILSGSMDAEVSVATLNGFCQAMHGAGRSCDLVIYPGASHGFFNPGVADGLFFRRTNEAVDGFLVRQTFLTPRQP
jgi:acetyl esterase